MLSVLYFLHSWKPTYVILSKHEEYLKSELEALQEATENERYLWSCEMRFLAVVLINLSTLIRKDSAVCIKRLL